MRVSFEVYGPNESDIRRQAMERCEQFFDTSNFTAEITAEAFMQSATGEIQIFKADVYAASTGARTPL